VNEIFYIFENEATSLYFENIFYKMVNLTKNYSNAFQNLNSIFSKELESYCKLIQIVNRRKIYFLGTLNGNGNFTYSQPDEK
jgi:hypothetical protein